ncbi:hypothetical protein IV454_00690 [Massilia antarctica]|uniref:Lipoprotein n=1 Tax=Massilia antarctica TaxID=2765360 RepID=A0AA49A862_9BURK|nr:hypothetical protein [Massilia antarctica]QPI50193.1 hypothetical protein IV454_00690 [Massilia antarctica]
MAGTRLAILSALLCVGCHKQVATSDPSEQYPESPRVIEESGDGRQYVAALETALRSADRIVVSEHSNVDDVLDPDTQPQRPVGYTPTIYISHELSAIERKNFLTAIRKMPAATQNGEPACVFEPHHTIAFYQGKVLTSTMRICFQCGQVEWNGTTKMRPSSLVPTIETVLSHFGMKAERDWPALAKVSPK